MNYINRDNEMVHCHKRHWTPSTGVGGEGERGLDIDGAVAPLKRLKLEVRKTDASGFCFCDILFNCIHELLGFISTRFFFFKKSHFL